MLRQAHGRCFLIEQVLHCRMLHAVLCCAVLRCAALGWAVPGCAVPCRAVQVDAQEHQAHASPARRDYDNSSLRKFHHHVLVLQFQCKLAKTTACMGLDACLS